MRVLFASLFILIIDQATKLLVKGFSIPALDFTYHGMYHGQRIPIIGDLLRLTFIENPGMAFGFDPGSDFKMWVSLFSLAASIGLLIYIYIIREQQFTLRLSIAFILGGAAGNLIDRVFYGVFYDYAPLFYGKVVDFIDIDFFDVNIFGVSYDRWPIFNVADMAVTAGVLMLIFLYKKHTTEEEQTASISEDSATAAAEPDTEAPEQAAGGLYESSESINKDDNKDDKTDNPKDLPL